MPIQIETIIKALQVGTDQTVTFANSDVANTQKTLTFLSTTKPSGNSVGEYEIVVYNPSAITDLTIKVFDTETSLGGATRDSLITTLAVPKAQAITGTTINTRSFFVHGIFSGGDCKLVISNDTVLGTTDTFSATVRVREVS